MNRKQLKSLILLIALLIPTFISLYPLFTANNRNYLASSPGSQDPTNPGDQNQMPNNGINIETSDIDLSSYEISGFGSDVTVLEQVSNSSSSKIANFYNVRSDGFIDYSLMTSYNAFGSPINTNYLNGDIDERRFSDLNDLFPLPYSENTFGSAKKIGRFENIWTPWRSNNWYVGIDVFERDDSGSGELDDITFYSAFVINSSSTLVVNLLIGSDDEVWVFKDGQSIWNQTTPRALVKDNDNIPITLNPGPNAFLIKVHDHTGDTGWCARFNQSGTAVTTGIKVGVAKTEELNVKIPSGWIDKVGATSIAITNLYETGNWIYELSPNSWTGENGGDTTDLLRGSSTDNYYTSSDDGTFSVTFTIDGSSNTASHSWDNSNPGWTSLASRQGSYGTPDSYGWNTATDRGGDGGQYRVTKNNPWLEPGSNSGRRWKYTVNIADPRDWEATSMSFWARFASSDSGAESDDRIIYYIRLVHPSNDASFYTVDSYDDSGCDSSGTLQDDGGLASTFNSLFPSVTSISLEIAMDIILPGTVGGSGDDVWGNIYELSFSITYTKKIDRGTYYYIYKNSPNFLGRQIPPTKAVLSFAYKRTGDLSSFPNTHIKSFIEGSELTTGRIYTTDIDTAWRVAKIDVTSKIVTSASDGIEVKIGVYIDDLSVIIASKPQILIDAIRLEIVVALDPDDTNIGMFVRNKGTSSDYVVSSGTYGSGTAIVALGASADFIFRFTGSTYEISCDYSFQTIYERSSVATTNYSINLDTNNVIWWISFDPVDVDTTLSDIDTYEFTIRIPRDWTIDPTGVWRPGEGFGVDSTPLQITDPAPGDSTKKDVRFYGVFPNGIMYLPFPVSKRDGRWQIKCEGVNYITSISSSLGTSLNPTNITQIQISIQQPAWTAWTTSFGNFTVNRCEDDDKQSLDEIWNFTTFNSITSTSLNFDYLFNESSVGRFLITFSWKSSSSPLEIGYNYIIIDIVRKTNININELKMSNNVVLDGYNITLSLPWWDVVTIPPSDNNVTGAIPWIKIYGDQQGNLTNKIIEDPGSYGWVSNFGEPYNGSNPEAISTDLTSLISITEVIKGNYTFNFNTSKLVNLIGPGNRTLKIEFNKPYHENISFLIWIFIISDTLMEWVDITTSGTDPKFAEAQITQGNSEYIRFRLVDTSRKRYENNYKNDINVDPFECIYLNNETPITKDRIVVNYYALNGSWIEPSPVPKVENITYENKEIFGINFKVNFDTPATDHNENLFYYFNFTITIAPDQYTMFQSAWCVNSSQGGIQPRYKMPGCLRVDVGTAQNTIQTVFVLNNTFDLLNKTWEESMRVSVKWNDQSQYNHSSGYTWNNGIFSLYLVLINDTTVTNGSKYPIPNGSAYISNSSGTHLGNVTFSENGWESRGGSAIQCTQVGNLTESLYRIDINVTSVPTIYSSETGSEYNIRLRMKVSTSFNVSGSIYNWEDAIFTLNLIVLPNDAEVSLEFFLPDRSDIYWGDKFNMTVSYRDTTNNAPITNDTGSVLIQYEILYYVGGSPYIIYTGYLLPSNQTLSPGQYFTATIDTNDPLYADNFSIAIGESSREFYIKVYAYDVGFTTPTPDPDYVIHRHKFYSHQWDFNLKSRIIDMPPPTGDHFSFSGWSGTAEIVRNDYLNFTIQIIDDSPRPIDANISLRASVKDMNVSWIIPDWFGLPVYKGWGLTDANGTVSFSVPTHYPSLSYDFLYELQVTFQKQNYASYTKSFTLKIIRIPVRVEWVGSSPGCKQGESQHVKVAIWDYAYNEHRTNITSGRVYCRVVLGPEVVYPEFELIHTGDGIYEGEINTWPAIFSWLEAKKHEIEFRIELPDEYVDVPYGTDLFDATIEFNIDTAGPFGPLTMPIMIILAIVGAVVGVYLSYKSYKFLTTPYPIRKINESLNKIKKNKKVASGVMKSRDHLIYLEMARRFKLIGITIEAPPKEKLEPIWEPSILKKEKEELMKKIPTIPLELIEKELKASGISDEELPIYMSQIKELDMVDRHDFISSLVGEEKWAQIEAELMKDMEKIESTKGEADTKGKETKGKKKK
ncbi:MAG: hypothetical protein ACTSPY_05560 [Candidatus Helarchaeota archaeon]